VMTNVLSIRDYLRLIFRRKAVLIIPFILAALLIIPLFAVVPTKYRADALIKRQDLGMLKRAGADRSADSGTSVRTLKREILTWDNLDRVIKQLKLDVNIRTQRDLQEKYQQLKDAISINSVARAGGVELIQISAIAETPDLAMQIANAIADNYVEQSKRTNRYQSEMAVDFLRRRVQEALVKLKDNNKKLDKYKKEYFEELPQMKDRYLAKKAALRELQDAKRYMLQATTSRLEQITKQLQTVKKDVVQKSVKAVNPDRVNLERQIAAREELLHSMLISFTEEHPEVVKVREEIARLKEKLAATPTHVEGDEIKTANPVYQELQTDYLKAQQKIKALESELLSIKADLTVLDSRIKNVVQQETTYADLVRERERYRNEYARYSTQLASAELEFDVETSRYGTQVDMIERALLPIHPYRLQRLKIALACLAGGAAAGIGLMFTMEFFDHSLRSVEDAAAFLPMPVLGSLSTIVSPDQIARRRSRNILILVTIVVLILLAVGALLLWEHIEPGSINHFLEIGHNLFK